LVQVDALSRRLERREDVAEAQKVLESLRRLSRLVEKLLQLARAEAGVGFAAERTDILAVARLLVEDYGRRPGSEGRLRLDSGGQDAALAMIDPDALGIALGNLIENALLHSPAATPVVVRLGPGGRISVTNEGARVPPEVLSRLTRRFERGAGGPGGTGLGLAIADAIMRQSGGRLELLSPAEGRADGFEARLSLRV
jgi:two-component system OmpR family sensor kinase